MKLFIKRPENVIKAEKARFKRLYIEISAANLFHNFPFSIITDNDVYLVRSRVWRVPVEFNKKKVEREINIGKKYLRLQEKK
jgi:hypothetical protein